MNVADVVVSGQSGLAAFVGKPPFVHPMNERQLTKV